MTTKKELISEYGNDFVAYDVTGYFHPLALCYYDEDIVLAYDTYKEKYSAVKMNYYNNDEGGTYFIIDGKRYKSENFVRSNSAWGIGEMTLDQWKKELKERV